MEKMPDIERQILSVPAPSLVTVLNELSGLLVAQGKCDKAEVWRWTRPTHGDYFITRSASYSFRNLVKKFRSFYKSGRLGTSRGTYFGWKSLPNSHGATAGRLCPPDPKCRSRAQRFPHFGPLQKDLARKRFVADMDVKQAVTS